MYFCMCPYAWRYTIIMQQLWKNRSRRRDKFLLRGVERVNITKPGGQDILSSTALCCEAVCFVGITGWRGLQHLIPGAMLKGITTWQTYNEDMVVKPWGHMISAMRPHVIYREDIVVNPWGHMIYVMRTYVFDHEDTCRWSIFNVPHTQIRHTSCLYGGMKPIRTLGSAMTCADHSVRDLFDIITVYGDMPLRNDHAGLWLPGMVPQVKPLGVNRTFLVLTNLLFLMKFFHSYIYIPPRLSTWDSVNPTRLGSN